MKYTEEILGHSLYTDALLIILSEIFPAPCAGLGKRMKSDHTCEREWLKNENLRLAGAGKKCRLASSKSE